MKRENGTRKKLHGRSKFRTALRGGQTRLRIEYSKGILLTVDIVHLRWRIVQGSPEAGHLNGEQECYYNVVESSSFKTEFFFIKRNITANAHKGRKDKILI